ncbi:hypothetical protein Tco_0682993 [Tanacetum coccineum]|uniref:Uncharacterized protein n=1 Tax=Tanacetum coccineum TaxID=301880 RepID=A0ABQ4XSS3_9ASTR
MMVIDRDEATYIFFGLIRRFPVLLAIPTPPPSPLSPWSSPLPQIPYPPLPLILSPLPVSPLLPVSSPPASPIRSLGYRAAMIWLRAEAPSTSHSLPLPPPIILSHTRSDAPSSGTPPLLPIPLPTSSQPLHLLFTTVEQTDPGFTLPPQKREIMQDLERDVGYGITDTLDEMLVDMPGHQRHDDTELGIEPRAHARTAVSWSAEVVAQQAVITELQAADRRRQAAITEMLAADHRRHAQFIEALKLLKRLQTQMTKFERQQDQ